MVLAPLWFHRAVPLLSPPHQAQTHLVPVKWSEHKAWGSLLKGILKPVNYIVLKGSLATCPWGPCSRGEHSGVIFGAPSLLMRGQLCNEADEPANESSWAGQMKVCPAPPCEGSAAALVLGTFLGFLKVWEGSELHPRARLWIPSVVGAVSVFTSLTIPGAGCWGLAPVGGSLWWLICCVCQT